MNNRHRRVARLKEQERNRELRRQAQSSSDLMQLFKQILDAWKIVISQCSKVFIKEDDH